MKKRFVTFFSPGTFVHETTTREIESWNVKRAIEMAHEIVERYDARPFGFQFSIRERKDNELDSRETERSPMYFLGGKVLTLQDVIERADERDSILISNMQANGYDKIIENTNSWKITLPLQQNDVVLDVQFQPRAERGAETSA